MALGSPRKLQRWNLLPWLVALVALLAHQLDTFGWFYMGSDDAYIYLGYVKNAISAPHELFAYNPGEHSAGTTGILYYYLLTAVCFPLSVALPFLTLPECLTLGAYWTNSGLYLALGATTLAVWRALQPPESSLGFGTALALFALIHANSEFLWGLFGGLENPLTAALLMGLVLSLLC